MVLNCKKCGTKKQKIVLESIDIDLIYVGNGTNAINLKFYCQNPGCSELLAVAYIGKNELIEI